MIIGGLTKFTLLDFPEKVAATVFTQGCVWQCPFCHNPSLLAGRPSSLVDEIRENYFWKFLAERAGKLDAVVISGGEPTLQPDLLNFITKIHEMGFLVKLDTNGTRPEILKKILDAGFVDYVAMDIKHAPEKYHLATGKEVRLENIKASMGILASSGITFEFRTTVVPGIHDYADFEEIGSWVNGTKNYYIQRFRPNVVLNKNIIQQGANNLDLDKVKQTMQKYCQNVTIRQ
jgi:pyruvate formate lyase activating enzyme